MTTKIGNNTSAVLSGKYTSAQAAEVLDVSAHQIVQLVHSGELDAVRTAGGAFLLDATSVTDYARLRKGKGRPFSCSVAWAALWLLSGLEIDWLTYQQRRRLLIKLRQINAEELVWLTRKRARLLRIRVDESFFDLARSLITASGASADLRSDYRLTMASNRLEGYVDERDIDKLLRSCHAIADGESNSKLRIVSKNSPISLTGGTEMPRAVVAVDLATSAVERERIAGLQTLKELLRGQHC